MRTTYTFSKICIPDEDVDLEEYCSIEVTFGDQETLDGVLEVFERFLIASGYSWIEEGSICYNDPNEQAPKVATKVAADNFDTYYGLGGQRVADQRYEEGN